MVPKVVSDAGYTVVGLGVLAVQQVQTRRRETRSRVTSQLAAGRQSLESAVGQVKARIEPLSHKLEPLSHKLEPLAQKLEPISQKLEPVKARLEASGSAALDRLTHLPGPLGGIVESGRERIQAALKPEPGEQPPARHTDQGKAKPEAKPTPEASSTE